MTTARHTHDFGPGRRRWGHDYIFQPINGGYSGEATGWGWDRRRIQAGDYLLLQNGDRTSRYFVDHIKYARDPHDMWFAQLTFAPRVPRAEAEKKATT